MGFPKSKRQKIIDGYLAESGRNMFVPSEFIDWLADKPDHECYDLFYGLDDEEAARRHRIDLARRFASGLRVVVKSSSAPSKAKKVQVTTREYPAMISPMSQRRNGGGYQTFDPEDPESRRELLRQAGGSLRSWLARYRGVLEDEGIALGGIESLVQALADEKEAEVA